MRNRLWTLIATLLCLIALAPAAMAKKKPPQATAPTAQLAETPKPNATALVKTGDKSRLADIFGRDSALDPDADEVLGGLVGTRVYKTCLDGSTEKKNLACREDCLLNTANMLQDCGNTSYIILSRRQTVQEQRDEERQALLNLAQKADGIVKSPTSSKEQIVYALSIARAAVERIKTLEEEWGLEDVAHNLADSVRDEDLEDARRKALEETGRLLRSAQPASKASPAKKPAAK